MGFYRSLMNEIEQKAAGLFLSGHYRDGVSLSDSILSGINIVVNASNRTFSWLKSPNSENLEHESDCFKMSKGVLLVNLGSPDSPSVPDVRRYLNEFLMDGRVIDVPWLVRRFIVSTILIKRPKESAHAYQKIWTNEGSPLIVTSRNVQRKLQERVEVPVALAMRYQNPLNPRRSAKTGRAGDRRPAIDSSISALRDVELRIRCRTCEGACAFSSAENAD